MPDRIFDYIIVGGGLAGGSAVEGIRELDKNGSVLLIGNEAHEPYDRPPLSKKLWFGQKKVEEIFVHPKDYYPKNGVEVMLNTHVIGLDPHKKEITDNTGGTYSYDKLLMATGGVPKTLPIPGAELDGVCYYRYLDDYLFIRSLAGQGKTAVVIGGGFIGSEMAAALNLNGVQVSMIFPEQHMLSKIFPSDLSQAIQDDYINRGIKMVVGDVPTGFEKLGERFITSTRGVRQIESDILIAGVGITPIVDLAQDAGLSVGNGIIVNEYLQTSNPDIYAAGDNAFFPYQAIGKKTRIEHWDNALNQGKHVGRNLAGANEPFSYMPYFFSDLFDFGFEAVGEVSTELEIVADWQEEFKTGVLYYLRDGKVKGAMMCNVWDKVDTARELIRSGKTFTPEQLRGAIK